MAEGIKFISRIITYCIIIMVVQKVINRDKSTNKEMTINELGGIKVDKGFLAKVYLLLAIAFAIIFAFVLSFPWESSELTKQICTLIFIIIVMLNFIMSVICSQIYLKLEEDKIYWRKLFKENSIKYEEIDYFSLNAMGNLKIYKNDKCVLKYELGDDRFLILGILKSHQVKSKAILKCNDVIIMKMKKPYVIFDGFCVGVFVIFLIGTSYYRMFFGMIFSFFMIIVSIFNFFIRKSKRIIVEKNTITQEQLFKKQKCIKFGNISHIAYEKENNLDIIVVHSKNDIFIKIPLYFENVEIFEEIASQHKWK